jgi:thymidine kinase
MAKLHFYYAAMNAGKSTLLLQSDYNYREKGMDTLLFVPQIDTRFGEGKIASRIGLMANAIPVTNDFNIYTYVEKALKNNNKISCVLVDEAQFLSKEQVWQLTDITDNLNIPVLAYGLRTDFRGELFSGSMSLLAHSDLLVEVKTICHCGKKASMNMRIDEQGNAVSEGNQIEIGGNDRYVAVCRKHFKEKKPRP